MTDEASVTSRIDSLARMAYGHPSIKPRMQGVDISRHQRLEEELATLDQMTLILSNFPLVQIGRSSRLSTELDLCREQGHEPQRQSLQTPEDEMETVIPNDVHSNSSRMLNIPRNSDTNCTDKDWTIPKNNTTLGQTRRNTDCRLRDVEYTMPLIKKHGSLCGKRYKVLMKRLEELQDNGKFDAHEDLVCSFLFFTSTKNKAPDIVASLMIQRGVAYYYANNHRVSRKLCKTVIRNMGQSLQNRNLLQGRAYVKLATTYRYEKKFGKAIRCLQEAQQLLSHHEPGKDTAELFYYYGVTWLDVYWNSFADEKSRQVFKARAEEYLHRAIAHSIRDERRRVRLKKETDIHMRVAALHLDSGTRAARETRHVMYDDIKEATKHLDFVKHAEIRPGQRIQLLKTRSDQYYREGKLCLAIETAQKALDLAKQINRNMEIIPLTLRIEERVKLLAPLSPDHITAVHSPSDSGWSAEASSN